MSMLAIFSVQAQTILMLVVGLLLKKKGIFTETGETCVADLVVYILLPCNIILSYCGKDISIFFDLIWVLCISISHQFFTLFLSRILWRSYDYKQRAVLQYSVQFSNCGFMGMPVCQGLFGSDGLLYASVYTFPVNFFMYTVGMSPYTRGEKHDVRYVIQKVLLHPCLIAVYCGVILMCFSLELPSVLYKTMETLSGGMAPLSMLLVGALLANTDIKHLFDKDVVAVTAIRMLAMPMLIILVGKMIGLPFLTIGVSSLLSGMPIGSMAAVFALKYKCDDVLAGNCIFFSTFVSMLSIPFVMWLSSL